MRKLSDGERMLVDFAEAWEKEHGEKFLIMWGGKDSKAAKDLAAMGVSWDDYVARRAVYLRDSRWWELCRHSFTGFVYNINKFVPLKSVRTTTPTTTLAQSEQVILDDEGHEVKAGQLCPVCYPKCAKCGETHYLKQTCEAAAEFLAIAKRITGQTTDERKRGSDPTTLQDFLRRT